MELAVCRRVSAPLSSSASSCQLAAYYMLYSWGAGFRRCHKTHGAWLWRRASSSERLVPALTANDVEYYKGYATGS